jgi:hypothetical protein
MRKAAEAAARHAARACIGGCCDDWLEEESPKKLSRDDRREPLPDAPWDDEDEQEMLAVCGKAGAAIAAALASGELGPQIWRGISA